MSKSTSARSIRRTAALPNVVLPTTRFVGRTEELEHLRHMLAHTRCLTLIGVGGCGKTRLAQQLAAELEAAQSFEHGVYWVGLESLGDPALVPQAVAHALGVRESQGQSVNDLLASYVQQKQLLLVIDNCEHLRAACAQFVESVLIAGPDVKILATSREPLALSAERTWLVPSLALPGPDFQSGNDAITSLTHYDAIQLFLARAAAATPDFALTPWNAAAIVQVCRQLDGLPLAIELAAARVRVLTVEQISTRLDNRLALLTSGNPTALVPRHKTLRAAIDWSYDLLSEREQILLRRLAVFAGGFTLNAAEAVCASDEAERAAILDSLSNLIDKSLLIAETKDRTEARYHPLETIRQYAAEKLREGGEAASLRRRQLDWYLALAGQAEAQLRGPGQIAWLERLEAEHDNLRAALAWSRSGVSDQPDALLHLAGSLFWYWNLRGHWTEGRRWLEEALARSEARTAERAKALCAAGELARLQGDHTVEQRHLEESEALWRALLLQVESQGSERVSALREAQRGLALTLCYLADMALYQSEHSVAQSRIQEALTLAQLSDDKWCRGLGLVLLGRIAYTLGDHAKARSLLEDGTRMFRDTADQWGYALALYWLGAATLGLADYMAACSALEEALATYRKLGSRWNAAAALTGLAEVARSQGDDAQAGKLYEESLAIQQELGSKWGVCVSLHNLGYVALHRGDYARAAIDFKEALSLNLERRDAWGAASCLAGIAAVAAGAGDVERAARLVGAAQARLDQLGTGLSPVDLQDFERNVRLARSRLDEATFSSACEAGRALSWEQALDEVARIELSMRRAANLPLVEPLNAREREVLRWIADGLSNHEIAERLSIAPGTVKWHITNLFGKLGVRSRTQALVRAKALGLL